MGKLKQSVLLLGEGATEFYYFNSIKCLFKGLTIKPDYPKNTNLTELESKISEGVRNGYSYIFCVIDMDTKVNEKEKTRYLRLKNRYSKPVHNARKGIHCDVRFFETHRCTELFFLYYFCYTSRMYVDQKSLIEDLRKYCDYDKTCAFFTRTGGLHSYFEKHSGSMNKAISHAQSSVSEKNKTGRDYTYSELGEMIIELKELLAD